MKHVSDRGLELIKTFEGCSLTAFWDVNGYAIGYGHHGNVEARDTITQEQADEILKEDLAGSYEPSVNKYDNDYNFNQNEFDALVSFCYNCGAGNLRELLKNGQATREQISADLPKYNKAGGEVLNGLVNRRNAELSLFNEPISTDDEPISTVDEYYPRYEGEAEGLDEILEEIGAPHGNWKLRTPLANANGINDYEGTYEQNISLINKAKAGELRRPYSSDEYYPKYEGEAEGLDEILEEIGAPHGNWKLRTPLANANGINDYEGTYEQNLYLLNMAKVGKLRRI
jgi:GH24 family phage-related lysozyme (muramidase)